VTDTAAFALLAPSTNYFNYADPADIVLADAEGRAVFDLTAATSSSAAAATTSSTPAPATTSSTAATAATPSTAA